MRRDCLLDILYRRSILNLVLGRFTLAEEAHGCVWSLGEDQEKGVGKRKKTSSDFGRAQGAGRFLYAGKKKRNRMIGMVTIVMS